MLSENNLYVIFTIIKLIKIKGKEKNVMSGMTMSQKILAAHAGLTEVKPGQLIEADLDLVLGNDITSPVAIKEMDKMNNLVHLPS